MRGTLLEEKRQNVRVQISRLLPNFKREAPSSFALFGLTREIGAAPVRKILGEFYQGDYDELGSSFVNDRINEIQAQGVRVRSLLLNKRQIKKVLTALKKLQHNGRELTMLERMQDDTQARRILAEMKTILASPDFGDKQKTIYVQGLICEELITGLWTSASLATETIRSTS